MTVVEMKRVLANKLKDENTYFTISDISIRKCKVDTSIKYVRQDAKYRIVIKDYEHCPFIMVCEYDEFFGYSIFITCEFDNYMFSNFDEFEYDIENALLYLGYHIGNTF